MTEVQWKDPPPIKRGHLPWLKRLDALVLQPNRWALVKHYENRLTAGRMAHHLNNKTRSVPPGRWEFVSRRTDDGGADIYARYLGPEE